MAPSLSLPAPWLVALLLSVATLTSGQCDEGRFGPGCGHLCHCGNGSACDVSSGECAEGCQEGYSGPWCQRRNAALGARIQGYWDEMLYVTYKRLADGNNETCNSIFMEGDFKLYVRLNSTADVRNIVIDMQPVEMSEAFSSVNVSSGDSICTNHQINKKTLLLHAGCDFRTDNFSLNIYAVRYATVCEVWVFVCEAGFHGEECDQLCGHCRNADCNQKTGTCAQDCEAGYTGSLCNQTCAQGSYGDTCSNICGRCEADSSCDPVTGTCTQGCDADYSGSFCNQTCAQGTYGRNCRNECGRCLSGSLCDPVNGSCAHGCEVGYTGSICNQSCAQGTFGENCFDYCGHCLTGTSCDPVNGTCSQGCEAGYTGSHCNQTCAKGTYGSSCNNSCGHCYGVNFCDPVTGTCPFGCEVGYTGSDCHDMCAPGRFGHSCARKCGHCGNGSACDPVSGSCSAGCDAGFVGEGCQEKCYRDTYGENCSQVCPPCDLGLTCDHVTGACPEMTDRLGTGVAVGVAVCVGVVGLAVGVWCLLRKRGCRAKQKSTESWEESPVYLTPIPSQMRTMDTKYQHPEPDGLKVALQDKGNP